MRRTVCVANQCERATSSLHSAMPLHRFEVHLVNVAFHMVDGRVSTKCGIIQTAVDLVKSLTKESSGTCALWTITSPTTAPSINVWMSMCTHVGLPKPNADDQSVTCGNQE